MGESADPGADGVLDTLGLSEEEERSLKIRRVTTALAAVGVLAPPLTFHPSPMREATRARVHLRVDRQGRLGMSAPGTHIFVEPPLDAMARPEVTRAAREVQAILQGTPHRKPRSLAIRTDGTRVVLVLDPDTPEATARALVPAVGPEGSVALGRRALWGDPWVRLEIEGLDLRFGPLTFYQVHLEVNALLVAHVLRWVTEENPTHVLDVFGGAGNLSLPVLARGHPVTLLESHPPAVADARQNALRNGLSLEVIAMDAHRLRPGQVFFDVAVLDPPRAGAGAVLPALCLTRPRRVVLVSCHPPSLGRDAREAMRAGYRVSALDLFDLFPLTHHVESVAVLDRI